MPTVSYLRSIHLDPLRLSDLGYNVNFLEYKADTKIKGMGNMASIIRTLFIGIIFLGSWSAQAGQKVYPKTEETLTQAFDKLKWEL